MNGSVPTSCILSSGAEGWAEVYRATDTRKDRGVVAVKRLPVGLAEDADFQRRFLREAQLAARLREPHIIPIHDYGQIQGRPFLEMRLVDGLDLGSLLEQRNRLAPPHAVRLLAQVSSALDAAHREGLVHRDVKPSNVLLDRSSGDTGSMQALADQFVYLIDFGIAANVLASHRSSSVVSGTAAYMAPERFSASGGDYRADVYALGCMLYELVTGQPPFGGDFMQLMGAHIHTPPPKVSTAVAGLPRALDEVVAVAMAKQPDLRYNSASEFAAAAHRAATASPGSPRPQAPRTATPIPPPSRHPSPPRRSPTLRRAAATFFRGPFDVEKANRENQVWINTVLAVLACAVVLVVVVLANLSPSH